MSVYSSFMIDKGDQIQALLVRAWQCPSALRVIGPICEGKIQSTSIDNVAPSVAEDLVPRLHRWVAAGSDGKDGRV